MIEKAKDIELISLSHQTVSRRINELGGEVEQMLRKEINCCMYFSIALDECVDITDVSQLLIFI